MTKKDVIAKVGAAAVLKNDEDKLYLRTAPKPYDEFEEYHLFFSPTLGLLKIVAIGKNIRTSSDGEALTTRFHTLEAALEKNYGAPEHRFDYLKSGSIWNEPQDFMMGLIKEDRTLSTFWLWKNNDQADMIDDVELEGNALRNDLGYLRLSYEFIGWDAYVDAKKAKKDDVL